MSTFNIGFNEELRKIVFQLLSDMHLIWFFLCRAKSRKKKIKKKLTSASSYPLITSLFGSYLKETIFLYVDSEDSGQTGWMSQADLNFHMQQTLLLVL